MNRFVCFVMPLIMFTSASIHASAFYTINSASYGNSYFVPQSFGDIFTPSTDIIISSLGVFDYDKDGLGQNHEVGIFDQTGTLLVSAIVQAGTNSRLTGDFRYTDITPLTLNSGVNYTIAALFTNTSDFVGYTNTNGIQVDPNISVGTFPARYNLTSGPVLSFPTETALASALFYANTNFEFTTSNTVPEPSSVLLLCGSLMGLVFLVLLKQNKSKNTYCF